MNAAAEEASFMTTSFSELSSYRPEIQGIRTIGALLVAVFHIWFGRVSGGVDVFFVVSGFLITGSLYKEIQRSQTINIIAFWGRIAKRIAPLAYSILVLTLLAALVWMPGTQLDGFLSEILYSAFHIENVKLMMNSVDYLARDEPSSPVQQFWALSVQVQFYAVWPFLLLAIAFAAKRLHSKTALYGAILATVFATSLGYSIITTRQDPSPAYFNTLARVWEFALGGILAVVLPHLVLPRLLHFLSGWIGLAAVVSCGFVLPASAAFPGYVALWPTLGAALVIISGGNCMSFGADRLLAWKPLVALGDLSLSFYLWHWPVLIFFLIVSNQTQLGILGGLGVIAIAFCGAYCTHRWLEQLIRNVSFERNGAWNSHAMGAAFMLSVLTIAGIWIFVLNRADMRPLLPSVAEYRNLPLQPPLAAASRDLPGANHDRCHQSSRKAKLIECAYGNVLDPDKTIALVGSSHAVQWLPALEVLARQHRWRIVIMTKNGCSLTLDRRMNESCRQWNEDVIRRLLQLRPDAIFTIPSRPNRGPLAEMHPTNDTSERTKEYVPRDNLKQWLRLTEQGLTIIGIRDTPWLTIHVPQCLAGVPSEGIGCGRPRSEIMDRTDPAQALQPKPANVVFIDLTDQFCDRLMCPPVRNNMIIYRDGDHLTATYARSLAKTLGERVKRARPDLFLRRQDYEGSQVTFRESARPVEHRGLSQ